MGLNFVFFGYYLEMKNQLATQDYIKTIAQLVIKHDLKIIKKNELLLNWGDGAAVNDMAKKLVRWLGC